MLFLFVFVIELLWNVYYVDYVLYDRALFFLLITKELGSITQTLVSFGTLYLENS